MSLVTSPTAQNQFSSTYRSANSCPLKFGFLPQAFAFLEQRPIWDLVAKDTTCYIIPQAGITRTKNELLDFLPNALGLLAVTVFGMLLLPPALRKPAGKISGIAAQQLKSELPKVGASQKVAIKEQLARLAVSFGFFFPFAAGFMSTPFFRNWLTLKRTGTMDFEQLIGLEKGKIHALSPAEQKMEAGKQLSAIKTILGVGAGLSVASLVGLSMLARKKTPFSEGSEAKIRKLFDMFALGGSTSNAIKGNLATWLFWLAPAQFGWILSARSRNEKIEQTVKAVNSSFWFSLVTPLLVNPIFLRQYEKLKVPVGTDGKTGWMRFYKGSTPNHEQIQALEEPLREAATKIWKRQSIASWFIPVAMLALTPQLLNIHFTKKRYERSLQQSSENQLPRHHQHTGVSGVAFGTQQNPFASSFN